MTSPTPRGLRLTTPPNFPGQDLVNKFIAATPSYFFAPIVGQHSFYFSELLRTISQAKKVEMINLSRETQQQLQSNRKVARKRPWGQMRSEEGEPKVERPLELTSKSSAFSPKIPEHKDIPTIENSKKCRSFEEQKPSTTPENSEETEANSTSQENLILPPPPPVWYPPLYAPYSNIDPANFFVDLRVSGHIFERKRELAAQALKTVSNNNNLPSYFDNDFNNKNRIGSAFSVPKSRELKANAAVNLSGERELSSPTDEKPKKFYDNGVTVYNIDSDEDGSRKIEQGESDDDETIEDV